MIKADLHIHSFYSHDGLSSVKEIIETALKKGINCLAITDHQEIKGSLEALRFAFDKNILVIPGLEIKTKEGDLLALGIKENIPRGFSALETIKKVKRKGGFTIIPHPFSWINPFKFKRTNLEELLKLIDAIEVLNAFNFHFANKRAFKFTQKYFLPFTAGSDAHYKKFIGKTYLEIKKEIRNEKGIFEEIRNKNVVLGGEEINLWERTTGISQKIIKIIKNLFYARRK